MRIHVFLVICFFSVRLAFGQQPLNTKFRQIDHLLPTPNEVRTASGAPGSQYWQQRADYEINVELDEKRKTITGSEIITYYNNSPDVLTYLWLQLDQNIWSKHADASTTETDKLSSEVEYNKLLKYLWEERFDGGYKISFVKDKNGNPLPYTINKTMMRIDLPEPLKPKSSIKFSVGWFYNINDHKKFGGRTGYEYFEADGNYIFEFAHWFPRMVPYLDYKGWQHKQFLGRGEFTLSFGDYKVNITVPEDHVVAATGELQNPSEVLTATQRKRLEQAANSTERPILIITPEEARDAQRQNNAENKRTHTYIAKNVRDFAWASSRRFIWDAMATYIGGKKILCMSYYPNEGNPLWQQYSTRVIAHTLQIYSQYTVNYEYPVCISVNGPVGGMEYPMICFNGPRPEADGTYSEQTKNGLISVIMHEVGHNFFPMIINSDERQWTWQDEGFNSFIQFLTEQAWDRNYPSRRGPPETIVNYMKGDRASLDPIMTTSDEIIQFGNNAYGKTAAALCILRETVMGRSLFDFAFKEYCRRWAYKHPTPADFFRTMEDASGMDLDWFFRAWFYETEPVDIALEAVHHYTIDTRNPDIENKRAQLEADKRPRHLTYQRNLKELPSTAVERNPELKDFYNSYDPNKVTNRDRKRYLKMLEWLTDEEKQLLNAGYNVYQLDFKNVGGSVSPLIILFTFEDNSTKTVTIPAEIWRYNNYNVSKVFLFDKVVKSVILDPNSETGDIDKRNNVFPRTIQQNRLRLTKPSGSVMPNPMQLEREDEK